MNYEQKYKESLKRARDMMSYKEVRREDMEYLFPELKESEDEKIRKELLSFCQDRAYYFPHDPKYVNINNWIAWLEKQGEQKPADKVEPKFKIGDWIITPKNEVLQITNIEGTSYVFNNESHYWEIYYCDKQCRLWTIEDAKDGEVLWHSNSTSIGIFIFNKIRDNGKVVCYCNYDSEDHFCLGEYHTCCWSNEKYIKPATKEQRNLLFTKMKEAGYEWDADKKVLNKVIIYE